jgi:hypothetical protein
MQVILFGQIESELVVDGEIVIARPLGGISVIVVSGITFLAMVAGQSFGAAVTLSRVLVAEGCLAITLTLLTGSTIDRVTPIAGHTLVAIRAIGQVVTWLQTSLVFRTGAVAIALARRTVCEMPTLNRTL